MRLTVPLFRMYAQQANNIRRDDLRMNLAIATNPHVESEKQGRLWDILEPKRARPRKEMSEEMKKEARAAVEAVRGKLNGV